MSLTASPGAALAQPFAAGTSHSRQPGAPAASPQVADAEPQPAGGETAPAAKDAARPAGSDGTPDAPLPATTAGVATSEQAADVASAAAATPVDVAPAKAVVPVTAATTPVGIAAPNKPIPGTAQLGAPQAAPAQPANAGSLGGAVLALFLVIGLILALAWLARRMPGLGGARSNAALRVVGTLALGPRERVVVVAVGETQLLLGVGAGGTRTLHTLAEPLPVAAAVPTTPAFAQLLAQHFGKKP